MFMIMLIPCICPTNGRSHVILMVCILMVSIGEYFIPYTYLSHDGDCMDIITILVIMYVLHLVITWFYGY